MKYISVTITRIKSCWFGTLTKPDGFAESVVGRTLQEVIEAVAPHCLCDRAWTPTLTAEEAAPYELAATPEGWTYIMLPKASSSS